jgi:hypothetical protein
MFCKSGSSGFATLGLTTLTATKHVIMTVHRNVQGPMFIHFLCGYNHDHNDYHIDVEWYGHNQQPKKILILTEAPYTRPQGRNLSPQGKKSEI